MARRSRARRSRGSALLLRSSGHRAWWRAASPSSGRRGGVSFAESALQREQQGLRLLESGRRLECLQHRATGRGDVAGVAMGERELIKRTRPVYGIECEDGLSLANHLRELPACGVERGETLVHPDVVRVDVYRSLERFGGFGLVVEFGEQLCQLQVGPVMVLVQRSEFRQLCCRGPPVAAGEMQRCQMLIGAVRSGVLRKELLRALEKGHGAVTLFHPDERSPRRYLRRPIAGVPLGALH